jgi:hypothetical protein
MVRYYFGSEQKTRSASLYGRLGKRSPLASAISEILLDCPFSSKKEYASLVKRLVSVSKRHRIRMAASPIYSKEIGPIRKGLALTERTNWGGVSLKKVDVENDYVRKLLVVGRSGVLGFEYHKLKRERLKVLEGFCLVLYSNHRSRGWRRGKTSWKIASAGDSFEFLPFDEHGLMALTDCVIEERSTNHLDDLMFIYRV